MRTKTTAKPGGKKAPSKPDYGTDQYGEPIEEGDTVIELRDGVPWIYTAGGKPKKTTTVARPSKKPGGKR